MSNTRNINELDAIFSKPAHKISMSELDELSSRIFSESTSMLNNLTAELIAINKRVIDPNLTKAEHEKTAAANKSEAKQVSASIATLKSDYNEIFTHLQEKIRDSCSNTKSIKAWIDNAARCQANGNDLLGYAIRNTVSAPPINKKFEAAIQKVSPEKQALIRNYFENFFNSGNYKQRVTSMENNAVSPALQFYCTVVENDIHRESIYSIVNEMRTKIGSETWKSLMEGVEGKSDKEIFAKIETGLFANDSKLDPKDVCAALKEYRVEKYSQLASLFKRVDSYFEQKDSSIEDPFISRYATSINSEYAASKPKPTVQVAPVATQAKTDLPEPPAKPKEAEKPAIESTAKMADISIEKMKIVFHALAKNKSLRLKSKKESFDVAMTILSSINPDNSRERELSIATSTKTATDIMQNDSDNRKKLDKDVTQINRVKAILENLAKQAPDPIQYNQLVAGFNQLVERTARDAKRLTGNNKEVLALALRATPTPDIDMSQASESRKNMEAVLNDYYIDRPDETRDKINVAAAIADFVDGRKLSSDQKSDLIEFVEALNDIQKEYFADLYNDLKKPRPKIVTPSKQKQYSPEEIKAIRDENRQVSRERKQQLMTDFDQLIDQLDIAPSEKDNYKNQFTAAIEGTKSTRLFRDFEKFPNMNFNNASNKSSPSASAQKRREAVQIRLEKDKRYLNDAHDVLSAVKAEIPSDNSQIAENFNKVASQFNQAAGTVSRNIRIESAMVSNPKDKAEMNSAAPVKLPRVPKPPLARVPSVSEKNLNKFKADVSKKTQPAAEPLISTDEPLKPASNQDKKRTLWQRFKNYFVADTPGELGIFQNESGQIDTKRVLKFTALVGLAVIGVAAIVAGIVFTGGAAAAPVAAGVLGTVITAGGTGATGIIIAGAIAGVVGASGAGVIAHKAKRENTIAERRNRLDTFKATSPESAVGLSTGGSTRKTTDSLAKHAKPSHKNTQRERLDKDFSEGAIPLETLSSSPAKTSTTPDSHPNTDEKPRRKP